MNIKTALQLSILCIPSSYSFALNLSNSPIQQVTLYPTLAKIERTIPVQAGEQLVTLNGLAANFNIDQLQYQSSNIEVNAVSHTDSALDKPAGNESSQLRNNIEDIKRKISEQNSIIQAAELQNKFLENVIKGSAPKVRKQAYEAFIAIDQAKTEKEKLEQRLQELEQDLNAIGDSEFNQRTLKFYVNAPQRGEIKISYMVPYARWQPIYKAELNTQTKQIKLTRMAMIAQKTGEDWNNVKLALSTATPQNYVQRVQPQQWWVNYYEPEPVRPIYPVAPAPMALAEMSYDEKSTAKAKKAPPQFPQFQAADLNFSTEFRSETKASIPSSQQQIFLPLSTEQYAAKLSVWAIPKQSTQATINAEISKLDQNWPSGTVKLYRDGDYIGQRAWSNSADEALQMSFGTDDQIQVKVTDLTDKKNPVKGTQSETIRKQQYSVQNLHSYPIQVTIFEAEPQSQNGKLSTQSSYSFPPTATQWNGQPNINQWQIDLNPKQIYKLDIQHQFKYPSKGRTSGF